MIVTYYGFLLVCRATNAGAHELSTIQAPRPVSLVSVPPLRLQSPVGSECYGSLPSAATSFRQRILHFLARFLTGKDSLKDLQGALGPGASRASAFAATAEKFDPLDSPLGARYPQGVKRTKLHELEETALRLFLEAHCLCRSGSTSTRRYQFRSNRELYVLLTKEYEGLLSQVVSNAGIPLDSLPNPLKKKIATIQLQNAVEERRIGLSALLRRAVLSAPRKFIRYSATMRQYYSNSITQLRI